MMFTKYKFVIGAFLLWRIPLLVFLALALKYVPLQANFIGGGHANYLKDPWLWSALNFDGEHYLAIAQSGYQPLTYFFFPVYPLLVSFLGNIFGRSFETLALIGVIVSHVCFFMALIGLWKIVLIDHSEKVARICILTMLFFPTSFFFASFYTESLFLMLVVWSFYFFKKEKFLLASVLGGVLSATRVIGSILVVSFFTEVIKKRKYSQLSYLIIIPIGIAGYMYFLRERTGDPFEFFNSISIFGQQRSANIVLLPQVFYRYIFKIIPSLNYSYFPIVFTTYLELASAILFLFLSTLALFRMKFDYAIYLFLGYLTPTLSGSFSSMPRYILVLFPGFILLSTFIVKWPRPARVLYFFISLAGLGVANAFFVRGIWVA